MLFLKIGTTEIVYEIQIEDPEISGACPPAADLESQERPSGPSRFLAEFTVFSLMSLCFFNKIHV